MNVGASDALILPVPPEPFALVVGPAMRGADPGAMETAIRHMGLRPERLSAGDDRIAGPVFRLPFGSLTILAGPAAEAALDLADPLHPSTSLLGVTLPKSWRERGQCWIFIPEDAADARPAGESPTRMREFFKTMVLLIDLFDASHIFWSPARLWSDAPQFRASVAEMLISGMPPVLHLVAFRRHDTDRGEMIGTRGLALFAGQELEGRMPRGWTTADMVKRMARLALDIMLNGPVAGPQRLRGMSAHEWIVLSPQGGGGGHRSMILVEFGAAD